MSSRKPGLGRGLDSLIPTGPKARHEPSRAGSVFGLIEPDGTVFEGANRNAAGPIRRAGTPCRRSSTTSPWQCSVKGA